MTNENVNAYFSAIANKYDVMNTLLSFNIDMQWRKKAIRLCNIKKDYKVIDLCCGTGEMIKEIYRQQDTDISVIGLDYNDEMLEVASRKLEENKIKKHFKLIKGDVLNIPFEDNSFDIVTIAFGLRNIPNHNEALDEMYRVLKQDGKLICLELSIPTLPVFKDIYKLYFNYVLPVIGYIGTGDKKAYHYLKSSVNGFMKKPKLQEAFEKSGFMETGYISLTGGIASIHYGKKNNNKETTI